MRIFGLSKDYENVVVLNILNENFAIHKDPIQLEGLIYYIVTPK